MALFPDRHPQKDFFILDISDAAPKDDTASMQHPMFSLATKPDMRHLRYDNGEQYLKIMPSGIGLPTIFDKDILIFCISQLIHLKNQGKPIGKKLRFSARELSIATNRPIGGSHYARLESAFQRLRGTTFTSNIRTGNQIETRIFGLIDEGGFVRTADEKFRLDYCEVVLSDWLMRAIENTEIVTISPDYFRLRRPLERRIYEIARKFCGSQSQWKINLDNLQTRTGSNAPLKKFRHNVRQIITDNNTPFYRIELTDNDVVVFRPRSTKKKPAKTNLSLPEWAEEQSRSIAVEKGWDYQALLQEWQMFSMQSGEEPKNAGAAFVGFCKKKESLR